MIRNHLIFLILRRRIKLWTRGFSDTSYTDSSNEVGFIGLNENRKMTVLKGPILVFYVGNSVGNEDYDAKNKGLAMNLSP